MRKALTLALSLAFLPHAGVRADDHPCAEDIKRSCNGRSLEEVEAGRFSCLDLAMGTLQRSCEQFMFQRLRQAEPCIVDVVQHCSKDMWAKRLRSVCLLRNQAKLSADCKVSREKTKRYHERNLELCGEDIRLVGHSSTPEYLFKRLYRGASLSESCQKSLELYYPDEYSPQAISTIKKVPALFWHCETEVMTKCAQLTASDIEKSGFDCLKKNKAIVTGECADYLGDKLGQGEPCLREAMLYCKSAALGSPDEKKCLLAVDVLSETCKKKLTAP